MRETGCQSDQPFSKQHQSSSSLRRDADLLRAEVIRQAEGLKGTWIDKVEVECRQGQVTPGPAGLDLVEELRRLMGEVVQDEAYRAEISGIADDLRGQLPPECRSVVGDSPEAFSRILAEAATDGVDEVLARLKAGAETG